MKKLLASILLLSINQCLFGHQSCELLKRASVQYCNEDLQSTLNSLIEFVERFPNHELCEEAFEKIADINFRLKKYDEARIIYETILVNEKNNAPDNFRPLDCPTNYHKLFPKKRHGCLRIIFPATYENLKHRSAMGLARIFNNTGKHTTALSYLNDAENSYPYRTKCGNDAIGKSNQIALLYSSIYLKIDDQKMATNVLLNEIMELENRVVLTKLDSLLKLQFTSTELRESFEKARANLIRIPADSNTGKIEIFRTNFLGSTIDFPAFYVANGQNPEDFLCKTRFYKEIIEK